MIVGVGQVTKRLDDPGWVLSPMDLIEEAIKRANNSAIKSLALKIDTLCLVKIFHPF